MYPKHLFRMALCGVLLCGAPALATVVFLDDFESGNLDAWTPTTNSPLENSGEANAVPSGGSRSAKLDNQGDRMHHNLVADNGGIELGGPSTASWYMYDPGTSAASRLFSEIRGYAGGIGLPNGGTTPNGTLAQLFAVGKYGTVTLPGEIWDATRYQARVTFGANAGWFNLNAPGAPGRSMGWHRFDVERLADGTTLNFYVDGILGRTIAGADPATWDTLIMGPGLGSLPDLAYFDGMQVTDTLVPEPATLVLFAAGGWLLRRQGRRTELE